MTIPSPTCVGAGQGGPPVSSLAWGDKFLGSCPQTSASESRTGSILLESPLGAQLSCPCQAALCRWEKILMGTPPLRALPVAVVPKVVSKGSQAGHRGGCAGLWAAHGCLRGGCSACGMQEGVKTGYPGVDGKKTWWISSAWWAMINTRMS